MKKFVFLGAFVAIAMAFMFVSCGEKNSEVKKLGEYELIEKGDLLGAKYDGHTVLAPEYEQITEEYGALFALKDGVTTIVAKGSEVLSKKITEVKPTANDNYAVIHTPDGVYLWKKGTGITRGVFDEVDLLISGEKEFVFCRDGNGWGAMNFEGSFAPRKYEKVYIAIGSKKQAVLVYSKKSGWEMYEVSVTDGVKYDTSSKVLEKQLKKFDTSKPYGILNVDWKL